MASESKVVGVFTTTGSSLPIKVRGARLVDVSVDFDGGSFSGQVDLERETYVGAGNTTSWQTVESYNASAEKVIRSATSRRYRLTASAVTSGEARYELTADNKE